MQLRIDYLLDGQASPARAGGGRHGEHRLDRPRPRGQYKMSVSPIAIDTGFIVLH